MAETTADVRRDIELTRERMSTTLQQLENKLNVKQVVRDNPWPALAIAVGAACCSAGHKPTSRRRPQPLPRRAAPAARLERCWTRWSRTSSVGSRGVRVAHHVHGERSQERDRGARFALRERRYARARPSSINRLPPPSLPIGSTAWVGPLTPWAVCSRMRRLIPS